MAMNGPSGRGPFWALRKRLRHADDTASSSMVTFIVGTSAFLVSSAVMLHFVSEPPGGTSGLEHADLKAKATNALGVLLGTPGVPADWGDSPDEVDDLRRLGLVLNGTSIRLDPLKFRALANGSYTTENAANGRIDYAEAVENLSLDGYNFHLRGYPLFEPFNKTSYGIEDMEDFRVAYVGDWSGSLPSDESAASRSERDSLAALAIDFDDLTRETVFGTGDAYRDDVTQLRNLLVPQLGSTPTQTVISSGGGSTQYDFRIINQTTCQRVLTEESACSRALALADPNDAGVLGYAKSRELRAVLGLANLSASTSGTLASVSWREYLDSGDDAGDYGWVEVSPDDGATWYRIATSTDPLAGLPSYTTRAAAITSANCGPCAGAKEVWVAFHWVADKDEPASPSGGWIIDNVQVLVNLETVFAKTFETPDYDMLVIGSNVDQNALTAAEVKNAIRDYVQIYGGRLLVLGGQTNTNWLQPLFHVGIRESSPGVGTPDTTHPLLTIPNQLDWEQYDHDGKVWKFSSSGAEELFDMVVGSGESEHVLSLSSPGAFGDAEGDGTVMLTTYLPHAMSEEQSKRFFANALTYGRYHRLYMEVGPPVPSAEAVASAMRTATMDKTVAGDADYIEMAFVLYVWPGGASPTVVPIQVTPKPPTGLTVTASDSRVDLSWTPPVDPGRTEVTKYRIYRGTMAGTETFLYETEPPTVNTSYVDLDVRNGQTYYYNVTAVNKDGEGSSSTHESGTPATLPGAPSQPSLVTTVPGKIALSWSRPADTGGTTLNGYTVYRSEDNVTFAAVATPTTTSYLDSNANSGTRYYYHVSASNALGEGPVSPTADTTAIGVATAPTLVSAVAVVDQIDLAWTAPTSDGGSPITSYRIYRGTSPGSTTLLAEVAVADPSLFNNTFSDHEVGANTTYHYNVTAVTAAGEGTTSQELSATTAGAPYPPRSLTATGFTGSVSLEWLAPLNDGGAPITGYVVCRGTVSSAVTDCSDVGLVTTYADTNVSPTTTYYYVVKAKNAVGISNPSNMASAQPLL